ncbi:hypothetical protein YN120080_144 [Staphylococcus phage vB_SauM_JDYN]|nr:hypothetical protein YN120080_144 [Staphylococcus phage vB_SauM_JDYN]
MSKHIEITMSSGAKYFLVSTDEKNYSRQDIDYMISGSSSVSVKVNTTEDVSSSIIYINPRRIESFKIVF